MTQDFSDLSPVKILALTMTQFQEGIKIQKIPLTGKLDVLVLLIHVPQNVRLHLQNVWRKVTHPLLLFVQKPLPTASKMIWMGALKLVRQRTICWHKVKLQQLPYTTILALEQESPVQSHPEVSVKFKTSKNISYALVSYGIFVIFYILCFEYILMLWNEIQHCCSF